MTQIRRMPEWALSHSLARSSFEAKFLLLSGCLLITQGCVAHSEVQGQQRMNQEVSHSYVPPAGFVPNSTVAVQIAEAVLVPIYGLEQVQQQRPFTAELRTGVWIVNGSLAPGTAGGVAIVELSRVDGRILRVSHER